MKKLWFSQTEASDIAYQRFYEKSWQIREGSAATFCAEFNQSFLDSAYAAGGRGVYSIEGVSDLREQLGDVLEKLSVFRRVRVGGF